MARKGEKESGRVFSLELDSGSDLKKVSVPNGAQRLLLEGTIGTLKRVEFIENSVLELAGSTGIIRIDLSREDIVRFAKSHYETRPES